MRRILEWLEHFYNLAGIAILFGLPVSIFATIGAWFVGHIEHLRLSYIAVFVLLVFGLTLWSWIGLIWLFDRAKQAKSPNRPLLECPWGIVIENSIIRLDPHGPFDCQVAVQIKNTYSFPIRADVISSSLSIENLLPDQIFDAQLPFMVMPGPSMTFNFPAFSKGRIPDQDRLKGKFELTIRYGHPDGDYSRIMSRWMKFDQIIKPKFPPGLFEGMSIPVLQTANQIPLAVGPYKEDEDKPYIRSKR